MLTDTKCRSAKPATKPYKLSDSNGLYLEVKPNGVKAWRYRYELPTNEGRRESIFAIGNYASPVPGELEDEAQSRRSSGEFTLAEARLERQKARGMVKQGINPSLQRKQDRLKRQHDAEVTFEVVARQWVAQKDWEAVTKAKKLAMVSRVVFPKIGGFPIKSVSPAQVWDTLELALENNGPAVAAEAKRFISNVYDWAISRLKADTNPAYPVRNALPAHKPRNKTPLNSVELGQLLRDVDSHSGYHGTQIAFRLMWLTLCRSIEAVGAQWSEFDLENGIWKIPATRMKMRREHTAPLPTQAINMLLTLRGLTGNHAHLFPHRDDRTKPMTKETLRQMIYKLGWGGKYSPHATRVTGSTYLNETGYNPDWIERQLAHEQQGTVRGTYNHASYIEQRRKMMQAWADHLDALKAGAEIIPLKVA